MQGIKKFLLVSLLIPFTVSPLKADEAPTDGAAAQGTPAAGCCTAHDSKKEFGPAKTALTVASIIFCTTVGYLALEKAIPECEDIVKKRTPKAKTKEGKALAKTFAKATTAVAGLTLALLLGRQIQKYVLDEKTGACPKLGNFI